MLPWLQLATAIACELVGTTAMRLSDVFTRPIPAGAVVVAYAGSFFFLSLAIRELSLGVANAVWSGVGIAVTAAIGALLFRERLDAGRLAGIGLIVAGVAVLNLAGGH